MKPVNTVRTPAAKSTAKTGKRAKSAKTREVKVPFSALSVSRWNRSFGIKPDDQYVDDLKKDIKRNGLIHPITLVARGGDGANYAILAGANRYWALKELHGVGSGLAEGEYVVREGISEDNPKCLDISLSENGHRRQPSVIETARYVDRLLQQENVDQKKLAPKLHMRREVVNRLAKLAGRFEQLPESWQTALSRSPSSKKNEAPVITLSHWVEVAAAIDEGDQVSPEVHNTLEKAAKGKWSTRELRKALKEATAKSTADGQEEEPPDDTGDTGNGDGDETVTPVAAQPASSTLEMVRKALESLHAVTDAVRETHSDQVGYLKEAAEKVEQVLKNMKASQAEGTEGATEQAA